VEVYSDGVHIFYKSVLQIYVCLVISFTLTGIEFHVCIGVDIT